MENRSNTIWVGLSFLVAGLAVGLLISNSSLIGTQASETDSEDTEEQVFNVDDLEFVSVSADDDPFIGDEDAPITIVEFSDFECPYCARFVADTMDLLKENYIDTGIVKLVYRDFPLPSHTEASLAAQAAECVGESGDDLYFQMHDSIFLRAEEWAYQENAEDVLVGLASELGVDISSCLANGDMQEEVNLDYTAGRGYGVSGTPTFFINGKKLVGAYPYEIFELIIEAVR